MKRILMLVALAVVPFTFTACTPSSSSAPAAGGGTAKGGFDQSNLDLVIPEMIRLMEAKEYVKVMKDFTSPDSLKSMTNGKPIEEAVKEMEPFFPMMLEGLKKAKDIKPTMENDGKKAIFKIVDKPGQSESVTFVKIDNKWYAGK